MVLSVETAGLTRRYGSVKAVDDLSLQVPEGSVFGFLGPNGSGKTTTLRMLLGLVRPNRGTVWLNGHRLARARRKALTGVGAIIEQPALYPWMSGRRNLELACTVFGYAPSVIDPVLDLVKLTHAAHRRVKGYSLGMRQRLAIARALMGNPTLLILDEPTNGLDPSGIAEMRELIKSLPARFGTTVLLSSHLLAEVEMMADHCALINDGALLFQGTMSALKARAGSSIVIEALAPERAAEVLAAEGYTPVLQGDWITAKAELDQAGRAAILQKLCEAQAGVSHFELRAAQLETLFLELTGGMPLPTPPAVASQEDAA